MLIGGSLEGEVNYIVMLDLDDILVIVVMNVSVISGQGRSQGGGIWGSEPPPIGPNFLVIFTKTLNKTMLRHVSAALPHPQNPLLWQFLASKPPP